MVRFAWHVEDGLNAFMLPGAYNNIRESSVRHAACEIEVPYSKETLTTCLTLPADYLDATKIRSTGIILAHGSNASEWKGKLLSEVTNMLAAEGYVVMRYCCRQKEQRRQKMFEKALDACATSPFARSITQWVLTGYGSGARIAAGVGTRCRGNIAGFVLISYPLTEVLSTPPAKSRRGEIDPDDPPALNSSAQPLSQLQQPLLFLVGDSDKLCPLDELAAEIRQLPSSDVRVEVFEDANGEFRLSQGKSTAPASLYARMCSCIMEFVEALDKGNIESCLLKRAEDALPAWSRAPHDTLTNSNEIEDAEMQDAPRDSEPRADTPQTGSNGHRAPSPLRPASGGRSMSRRTPDRGDRNTPDRQTVQGRQEEMPGEADEAEQAHGSGYPDAIQDSSRLSNHVSNVPRSMLSSAHESAEPISGAPGASSESFAASYQPPASQQVTATSMLLPAASSQYPPYSQFPATSSHISHHSRGDYADASPQWAQSYHPAASQSVLEMRGASNNPIPSEPAEPYSMATNQQSRNHDGLGVSHHESGVHGYDKSDTNLRFDQHSTTGANNSEHPQEWSHLAGQLQSNESIITHGTQMSGNQFWSQFPHLNLQMIEPLQNLGRGPPAENAESGRDLQYNL